MVSIFPIAPWVPASRWDSTTLSSIIYSELFWPPVCKDGVVLSSWVQIDRAFIKYTTSMVNAQGWEILKPELKIPQHILPYFTLLWSNQRWAWDVFMRLFYTAQCSMVAGEGTKVETQKQIFEIHQHQFDIFLR